MSEKLDPGPGRAKPSQIPLHNLHNSSRPGFAGRLRTWLLTGLLVTAPIVVSLYITWTIIHSVDRWITPLIPERYLPETYLPFAIPGMGLLIVALGLTVIGALTASLLGRYFLHLSDHMLVRMPVVRSIYSATKQIFETVLSSQGNAFRSVVLIEYPRPGIWTLGFLTGTSLDELRHHTGRDLVNVFVPTTPNPTSGFLLFLPREDVIEMDMSVEAGIKMIVSGGIVTPPDRLPKAAPDQPQVEQQRNAS